MFENPSVNKQKKRREKTKPIQSMDTLPQRPSPPMDEALLSIKHLNPLVARICAEVLWELDFYSFDDISTSAITPIRSTGVLWPTQLCLCSWYNHGDSFTVHFRRDFEDAYILLDVEVDQLEHEGVLRQCTALKQLGQRLTAWHAVGQELVEVADAVANPEVWVDTFLYFRVGDEHFVEESNRTTANTYQDWEQTGKPVVAESIDRALAYAGENAGYMSDQMTDHSE